MKKSGLFSNVTNKSFGNIKFNQSLLRITPNNNEASHGSIQFCLSHAFHYILHIYIVDIRIHVYRTYIYIYMTLIFWSGLFIVNPYSYISILFEITSFISQYFRNNFYLIRSTTCIFLIFVMSFAIFFNIKIPTYNYFFFWQAIDQVNDEK